MNPQPQHPLPSSGGSYERRDGALRRTDKPTQPHPGKTALAAEAVRQSRVRPIRSAPKLQSEE